MAHGVLHTITSLALEASAAARSRQPHLFVGSVDGLGPTHLFVENVALMLGCSVDYVRRLTASELPRPKVGQRLIYARMDVEALIASRRSRSGETHVETRSLVRLKSHDRQTALSGEAVFDPAAQVKAMLAEQAGA